MKVNLINKISSKKSNKIKYKKKYRRINKENITKEKIWKKPQ